MEKPKQLNFQVKMGENNFVYRLNWIEKYAYEIRRPKRTQIFHRPIYHFSEKLRALPLSHRSLFLINCSAMCSTFIVNIRRKIWLKHFPWTIHSVQWTARALTPTVQSDLKKTKKLIHKFNVIQNVIFQMWPIKWISAKWINQSIVHTTLIKVECSMCNFRHNNL